jgi:hypothetical protein
VSAKAGDSRSLGVVENQDQILCQTMIREKIEENQKCENSKEHGSPINEQGLS